MSVDLLAARRAGPGHPLAHRVTALCPLIRWKWSTATAAPVARAYSARAACVDHYHLYPPNAACAPTTCTAALLRRHLPQPIAVMSQPSPTSCAPASTVVMHPQQPPPASVSSIPAPRRSAHQLTAPPHPRCTFHTPLRKALLLPPPHPTPAPRASLLRIPLHLHLSNTLYNLRAPQPLTHCTTSNSPPHASCAQHPSLPITSPHPHLLSIILSAHILLPLAQHLHPTPHPNNTHIISTQPPLLSSHSPTQQSKPPPPHPHPLPLVSSPSTAAPCRTSARVPRAGTRCSTSASWASQSSSISRRRWHTLSRARALASFSGTAAESV